MKNIKTEAVLEGIASPRRRNSFVEAKGSFAKVKGSFAEAKGSFADAKLNDCKRRPLRFT